MTDKTAVINRLKRVNGQIAGLITLIEAEADCDKVFVQFQAAKSALNGAFAELLKLHLKDCSQKKDTDSLAHLVELITKN